MNLWLEKNIGLSHIVFKIIKLYIYDVSFYLEIHCHLFKFASGKYDPLLNKTHIVYFKRDLRANLEVSVTKVLRIHSSNVQTNRLNKIKLNSAATESDDEVIQINHDKLMT